MCPLQRRPHERARRHLLPQHEPFAVHLYAIERDEPTVGIDPVGRIAEKLRGIAKRWEKRRFGLNPILPSDLRLAGTCLKLRIVLARPLDRFLQRDHARGSGGPARRTNGSVWPTCVSCARTPCAPTVTTANTSRAVLICRLPAP